MSKWKDIFGKLNDREFEAKEEYWKELEKALDQHSAKKRGISYKWWLSSLLLLMVSSFSIYFFQGNNSRQIDKRKQEIVNTFSKEKNKENANVPVTQKNTGSYDKKNSSALSVQKNSPVFETKKSEKTNDSAKDKSVKSSSTKKDLAEKVPPENENQKLNTVFSTKSSNKQLSTRQPSIVNSVAKPLISEKNTTISTKKAKEKVPLTAPEKNNNFTDNAIQIPKEMDIAASTPVSVLNLNHPVQSIKENKIADPNLTVKNKEANATPGKEEQFSGGISVTEKNSERKKPTITNPSATAENNKLPEAENNIPEHPLVEAEIIKPYATGENIEPVIQAIPLENVRKTPFRPQFSAGIYGGMMYTSKIIKSKDASLKNYIDRRKAEEKEITTLNAGADISIGLKRWSLTTGLNYHKQGEQTEYKPEFFQWVKQESVTWNVNDNSYWNVKTSNFSILVDSSYWTTKDTTITYWNSSTMAYDTATIALQQYYINKLDTAYFYLTDSTYIVQIVSLKTVTTDSSLQRITEGIKTEKQTTSISYFELPLLIGYEFHIKRLTLMVRTGVGLGRLSEHHVSYIKQDISGIEEIEEYRINKFMLNYLLRISALHYLTERIAVNIEPSLRMNINSVFRESNFSQRYRNVGVNAGLIYRF